MWLFRPGWSTNFSLQVVQFYILSVTPCVTHRTQRQTWTPKYKKRTMSSENGYVAVSSDSITVQVAASKFILIQDSIYARLSLLHGKRHFGFDQRLSFFSERKTPASVKTVFNTTLLFIALQILISEWLLLIANYNILLSRCADCHQHCKKPLIVYNTSVHFKIFNFALDFSIVDYYFQTANWQPFLI